MTLEEYSGQMIMEKLKDQLVNVTDRKWFAMDNMVQLTAIYATDLYQGSISF